MSKELATLIEDARWNLLEMQRNVSEAINFIDKHNGKISTKGELRTTGALLGYIRFDVEKLAEIDDKLSRGKFF